MRYESNTSVISQKHCMVYIRIKDLEFQSVTLMMKLNVLAKHSIKSGYT